MIELNSKLDYQKIKNDNLENMHNSIAIKTFLNENQLGLKTLEDYYLTFSDFYKNHALCANCPGLEKCRQASRGQRLKLVCLKPENIIINELCNCEYTRQKNEKEKHLGNFVYNDIPLNEQNVFFEDLLETTNDKRLCVVLGSILKESYHKGIYLYGDLGVGKTYLCIGLLNSLAKRNHKVAFVKTTNLINQARNLTINDKEAYEDLMHSLMTVPYLCLDDIGAEGVTVFSRDDVLFTILDYRMEHQLLTLFTSNLDIETLNRTYQSDKNAKEDTIKAKRLLERITCLATPYCLKGENLRHK